MINILEVIEFRVIGAVIILLVGLLLGLVVKKLLSRALHEIDLDKLISKLSKKEYPLEKLISRLAAYLVYFITILFALNQLGITSVALYIILAVILLILGTAFLIGIKDFIPNLIAGLVLTKKTRWVEGKEIKFNGVEGKIRNLGLLEVEVETKKGERIYLPNSLLTKSKVWLK